MAEEEDKVSVTPGVVVEFDYTAIDGSQILFDVAKKALSRLGVDLTVKLEAKHLVGGNYQGGLRELFADLEIATDATVVAHELSTSFKAALTEACAAAVTPDFKAFVKTLTERGVKVVIATRANLDALRPAVADLDSKRVVLYTEVSSTYGNCKWDAWRRAFTQNDLMDMFTVAVTGSGKGVKSALVAGLSVIAVEHDHVAYQDFGGADALVRTLDAKVAAKILRMLHV